MDDSSQIQALLQNHLNQIRVPQPNEKIYKDECVYSFDTPDHDTGLYVCLQTFFGLGRDYVERHFQTTGSAVYLHIKRDRIETEKNKGDGPERKVTRLAIGVEGGFDPDGKSVETTETYNVVVLPEFKIIPWPCQHLPLQVQTAVQKIIDADSATKLAELEAMTNTWDGEVRQVSRHAASLVQLNNGVKIPPSGWKCEKCDLTTNLWLNLTDGVIMCGRKYFDGSGGNEHALEHYKHTGYPLAVKLGTITKEGKGDVYSYDEDDMVEDPLLVKHLAHFGINIHVMEKTDKCMAELELDLNQKYNEWYSALESSNQLKPIFGPGFTGLGNLGNSCYLNSVVQVIFTIPDFLTKYVEAADSIFRNCLSDPADDFNVQMAKIGKGLLSGKYSIPPPEGPVKKIIPPITPFMFKNLVGRGHRDFSTKFQQDAQEFFLHLINLVQRNSRGSTDPSECFKIKVEDRFQCGASGKVKYTHRTEYCVPLSLPMDAALNKEEVEEYEAKKASGQKMDPNEIVRPRIKLSSCLETFSQVEIIEQFYSSAINGKTTAQKTTRFATFPDYLLIHLKKFTLREDWVPVKLDVAVEMPDELDLESLRGSGLQAASGEEELPEVSTPPVPQLDQNIIGQLVESGFPLEAVKKAVYFTESAGFEQATSWLMEHVADSDFTEPFVVPGTQPSANRPQGFTPDEEALSSLMALGFNRAQATKALKATSNNLERAADWIFSHADELDQEDSEMLGAATPNEGSQFRDGPAKYQLAAFITHMGPSSMVGHYVCHILKDGQWVVFNDDKVAISENPPKELGYLYLYRRTP